MPSKRWTTDSILEVIGALHRADEDLTYTGLSEAGFAAMYAAAKREFGGWPEAIAAAGLPPEVASRRHGEKRWTRRAVLAAIKRRDCEGRSLAFSDAWREDRSLLNGAVRHFDSWRDAVLEAGLDYGAHYRGWEWDTSRGIVFESLVDELFTELGLRFERHPSIPTPSLEDRTYVIPDFVFPGNHWWDAKLNAYAPHVDDCIERYLTETEALTIIHLDGARREHPRVAFVSFEEYLEEHCDALDEARVEMYRTQIAALRSNNLKRTQLDEWALRWTRDVILEEIRALADAGESLVGTDVQKAHPQLYGAVGKKQYFDGWYDAVTEAGYDGDAVRAEGLERARVARIRFPREWCTRRLVAAEAEGVDLSVTGFRESHPQLYAALIRHWDTYLGALEAHGIDPSVYRRQAVWTRQSVCAALTQRRDQGLPITPTDLREQDPNLYSAIRRPFGTLELAAREARIEGPITRMRAPWLDEVGRFSRERFREALVAREAEGLAAAVVLREAPDLYHAARRHLDGWYEALDELGFDVAAIRETARPKPRIRSTDTSLTRRRGSASSAALSRRA